VIEGGSTLTKSFHFGARAALPHALLFLSLIVTLLSACSKQQPQQAGEPAPSPQTSPPTAAVPQNPVTTPALGQPPNPSHEGVRTFSGTGLVTVVNRKEGWVEINHQEIKGLMPAMQMAWYVKKASVIGSIKVGDKVDFEIEDNKGSEVLTKIKKAQAR
jgi:Cu/Ag efflux protein CusF